MKGYAGVYVLNLGKFELATSAYTVDKLIDTPAEKFYRIQANLSQNVDLRRYPFDEHLLTIEIEDKRGTVDKVVYVVDKKNWGGWRLAGWEAKFHTHHYEIYGETYSRFVFGLRV